MSLSIDPSLFPEEAILKSLEGEQVVRVSRKAIVDALKAQTQTISALFQDAVEKADLIRSLEESNRNLTKLVYDLSDKLDGIHNKVDEQGVMVMEHEEILGSGKIEKLFVRVDALEAQMEETEQQMKQGFQEALDDRARIETDTVNKFRDVQHSIKTIKEETNNLDIRANSLEERMKDLGFVNKDGIFRIRSERVAVGANEVPVDEMFKGQRADLTRVSTELRTTIGEHTDVLDAMAPRLRLLPELIETANANKKMFSDLGLAGDKPGQKGILQQFKDMKEDMVDVQKTLLEKCDIKKMLETVELKYDEIVDHLQEAIQAAVEDEDQFKKVTEELKEMCKNLMMNKADKIALIELNERLNVTKVLQEEMKDMKQDVVAKVSRDDLNEMLLVKGQRDKEEYKDMMSGMARKLEKNITRNIQQSGGDNMDSNSFGGGFGIGGGNSNMAGSNKLANKRPPVNRAQSYSGSTAVAGMSGPANHYGTGAREEIVPETHGRARLGPGGPSLGGGFNVMLPVTTEGPKRMKLPKVSSNKKGMLTPEDNATRDY